MSKNIEEITDSSSMQQLEGETKGESQKRSYLFGVIGLAGFCLLGGFSYCPWYIWIVVVLLVVMTLSGLYKGFQCICTIVIILFGTPVLSDDTDGSDTSGSYQSISSTNSSYEKEFSTPSWINGTWIYKGYSSYGDYVDVCVKLNTSSRQAVIVSNIGGSEVNTFTVSGNSINLSDGSVLYLNNSNHTIEMGGGITLSKR